ncbi:MAG: hypothetical protein HY982_01120 [Candidatus Magasanikbacteria bacterium]|nr:hypothetical protein [Candidatus Magasanikbacteria bacterium]
MSKKQIIFYLFLIIIAGLVVILILRAAFFSPAPLTAPPVTQATPASKTPGLNVWSGALTLSSPPVLTAEGKDYFLKINQKDAKEILVKKGFKNGDAVNIMGKISGNIIEISGLNKLEK